jgi:hypothetical protein
LYGEKNILTPAGKKYYWLKTTMPKVSDSISSLIGNGLQYRLAGE